MRIDADGTTIYDVHVATEAKSPGISATEEAGATPIPPDQEAGGAKESTRSFLQAARRNLTEEEASSPAGIRWLTHDVERLDLECARLREEMDNLRERYDILREQYNDKR